MWSATFSRWSYTTGWIHNTVQHCLIMTTLLSTHPLHLLRFLLVRDNSPHVLTPGEFKGRHHLGSDAPLERKERKQQDQIYINTPKTHKDSENNNRHATTENNTT